MENECEMSVDDLRRLCLPGVVQCVRELDLGMECRMGMEWTWKCQGSASGVLLDRPSSFTLAQSRNGVGSVCYDGSPPTSLRGASLSCDSGRSSEDSNRRVRFH